jgi:hypothetical protein
VACGRYPEGQSTCVYNTKSVPSTPTEEIVASLQALFVDAESIFCEGRNSMTVKHDASVKGEE